MIARQVAKRQVDLRVAGGPCKCPENLGLTRRRRRGDGPGLPHGRSLHAFCCDPGFCSCCALLHLLVINQFVLAQPALAVGHSRAGERNAVPQASQPASVPSHRCTATPPQRQPPNRREKVPAASAAAFLGRRWERSGAAT